MGIIPSKAAETFPIMMGNKTLPKKTRQHSYLFFGVLSLIFFRSKALEAPVVGGSQRVQDGKKVKAQSAVVPQRVG